MRREAICSVCDGEGSIGTHPEHHTMCTSCDGFGIVPSDDPDASEKTISGLLDAAEALRQLDEMRKTGRVELISATGGAWCRFIIPSLRVVTEGRGDDLAEAIAECHRQWSARRKGAA